jgi:hypothetical protein
LMSGASSYSNVLGRRFGTGLGNINGPSAGERRLGGLDLSENPRRAKFGSEGGQFRLAGRRRRS